MKIIKKFYLFLLFLYVSQNVMAVSAYPYPITFTQPNGETVTVMLRGDERIHWHESVDGYTLLFNQAGYLTYAQLDENKNLHPSDFIATNIEKRNSKSNSFLNSIEKKLFYSDAQKQIMLSVWQMEDETVQQNMSKSVRGVAGSYKILCAFVKFNDKSFIKNINDFDNLMNQLGYKGDGGGSVRDYFKEISYGQLDLTITLCGIYTAPKNESYYAGNNGAQYCGELAKWLAEQVAKEPNINFKDYDSNKDGYVDGFHFIFAGIGQETEGDVKAIWSHKGSIQAVTQNGTKITNYSCSPELLFGTTITSIGTICHEMTHAFGADDFYDTNYETGGHFFGTGNWDLMGSGSWNANGNSPAHPNMYIKVQFGWVTPVILNTRTTITSMPNSAENPVAYRINTTTNNEYFLLENRQRIKFDSAIPGNGLLIYRVHSNIAGAKNCINCTHQQRMYPVCASATVAIPNSTNGSYGDINSAGCPFPGTSNQTSFTDNTAPSMKSWAGDNTNKPITNIKHSNRLISFNFMDGAQLKGSVTINGSPVFGETLTAIHDLTSIPEISDLGAISYHWKRGDVNIGTTNTPTYTLKQNDIGNTITVIITTAHSVDSVTSEATDTVIKATQVAPEMPELASNTENNITLKSITGCEYRMDGGDWQLSNIFNNLSPDMTYNFEARKAETDTHFASEPSPIAQFITDPDNVGIDENEYNKIDVYSYLNHVYIKNVIKTEYASSLQKVEILDMTGRLIYQSIVNNSETVISLQVPNGIYHVKLISQEKIIVKKVSIMM